MTVLKSVFHICRDIAEGWRELFRIEPSPETRVWHEGTDDDERNAEAREKERIELAIMTAHFHF